MNNDNTPLFKLLADKTREGKLQWGETAKEGAFIAAVNNVMVFRLELILLSWKYADHTSQAVHLEAIDEHGESLFRIISQTSVAKAAWRLAEHNSQRPHVEVAEAILLLESL